MTPQDGDLVDVGDGHLYYVTVEPWGYTGADYFDAAVKQNWDADTLEGAVIWRKVPEQS